METLGINRLKTSHASTTSSTCHMPRGVRTPLTVSPYLLRAHLLLPPRSCHGSPLILPSLPSHGSPLLLPPDSTIDVPPSMHPNRRCPYAPQEIKLRIAYYKASARLHQDCISTLACCKARKRLLQVFALSRHPKSGELQAVCCKGRGVAAAG